jgi:multidrug resistance efflux pump
MAGMKLRFSIRELILVTAIVALAVGWWLDRHSEHSWRSTVQADGTAIANQKTGEVIVLLKTGAIGHSFNTEDRPK